MTTTSRTYDLIDIFAAIWLGVVIGCWWCLR
jgi:UPF0716 family protein affecting phage T7 exclusion